MSLDFKLYEYQRHALLSKAIEILLGGAAGPGKSYFLRIISILLSIDVPGIHIYLFRRLRRELFANHVYGSGGYLIMLKDLMDAQDVVFNKTENMFEWYNGSRIFLCYAQYEEDIMAYLGTDINVLLVDEAVQFTETMLRFLRGRVRLGGLEVPQQWKPYLPKIIYGTNPRGPAHGYLKRGFVDVGERVVFRAPPEDGGMLREYVRATFKDNLIQMKNDPEYEARLLGLGDPELIRAYRDGDWDVEIDGPLAGVWVRSTHVLNKQKTVIPHTWSIERAYDYGSSAPAAVVYTAECDGSPMIIDGVEKVVPARTLVVVGEVYLADRAGKGLQKTPLEQAQAIKRYEEERGWKSVRAGPADNMIFSATPGFATIAGLMERVGIKFGRSDKTPGSRKKGLQYIKEMLAAATRNDPEMPHLYFLDTAGNCIRTIPNLPRSEDDPDDVDTTAEDHLFDALRYRVLKLMKTVRKTYVIGA